MGLASREEASMRPRVSITQLGEGAPRPAELPTPALPSDARCWGRPHCLRTVLVLTLASHRSPRPGPGRKHARSQEGRQKN